MSVLEHALEYAERGWAVFPLRPRSKQPATTNGFKDATTDTEQIRRWFTDTDYNIACAVPEGYWIFDCDPRNGGLDTWGAVASQLPSTTLRFATGGGGTHLWFKGEAPNVRLPGIDIKKGGRGYVVMPPSIHPETGNPYTVETQAPVATFSGPLHFQGSQDTTELLTDVLWLSGGARGLAESDDPIPAGQQHDTLVQIAGHVLSVYPPAIARIVYDAAVARCEPAHPDREAERIWEWTLDRQVNGDGLVQGIADAPEVPVDGSAPAGGQEELKKLQAREWALRQREEEAAKSNPLPVFKSARQLLEEPETDLDWRIEEILPVESVAVLHAGAKVGKSHIIGHAVHSLLTGNDFLGQWATTPTDRNVVLVDLELSERVLRSWSEKFRNDSEKLRIASLRGNSRAMDIMSDAHFARVVDAIASQDPGVLIIDPLGPMLGARGIEENDNGAVRGLLDRLMDLKRSAGVDEMIVSHHAGHGARNRTRGASVFMDWPDVMIGVKRKNEEDMGSPRILSAYGRDVNLPNTELSFDPITQVLSVADVQEADSFVLAYITRHPGVSRDDIQQELKRTGQAHSTTQVHKLIKELLDDDSIREEAGAGRGAPKVYFPNVPLS